MAGKIKVFRTEVVVRARLNRPIQSVVLDPKPGDLSMGRLKLG